jgi:predicted TIM-barrel fold metal-dependent hydrolase
VTAVRVDVHTHLGKHGVHVNDPLASEEIRAWGTASWDVEPQEHRDASRSADHSIVLAFDAEPVGVVVPNAYVAAAIEGADDLTGFASVNPNRPGAPALLDEALTDLGLRGLKLGPCYQHFHPQDAAAMDLLEVAQHHRAPVLWHQGTTFTSAAMVEYARPLQLDLVARRFPDLPMWIAHFGHPWMTEAVSVIRRHEHFYIDVSAMDSRPWQLAQSLAAAYEYRVLDRVLFGTDYPFSTVERTVAGLRAAAKLCRDLGIAPITDDDVDAICQRDSLALLGLTPTPPPTTNTTTNDTKDAPCC